MNSFVIAVHHCVFSVKKWVTVVFLAAMLVFYSFASASDLNTLEAVVSEAETLGDFLKDKKLQDKYYEALKEFFGGKGRFPRARYDQILGQLQVLYKKEPEVANRLWATNQNLGKPFEIETELKTYGRTVEENKWSKLQDKLKAQFKEEAGDLFNMTKEQRKKFIEEALEEIAKEKKAFEKSIEGLPKKEAKKKTREFSKKIISKNKKIKKITAYTAHEILSKEHIGDRLRSGDADVIFSVFDDVQKNPGALLDDVFDDAGIRKSKEISYVESALKKRFPSSGKLLSDVETFPHERVNGKKVKAGGKAKYRFEAPKRRIHTIWKGVPLQECIGGSCKHVSSLHPGRWASAIVDDVQFHYVVQDGRYRGFVQQTGVINTATGKVYGSVDIGVPALGKKAVIYDSTGKQVVTTLYDLWLPEASKNMPKTWNGLVVGTNYGGDNAGVLKQVHRSPSFQGGTSVGKASNFIPTDQKTAKAVSGVIKVDGTAVFYGRTTENFQKLRTIIIDATIAQQETLTVLKPVDPVKTPELQKQFLNKNLKPGASPHQQKLALDTILDRWAWTADDWKILTDILKHPDSVHNGHAILDNVRIRDWPKSFWDEVPEIWRSVNELNRHHLSSGVRYNRWPRSFWEAYPDLIRNSSGSFRNEVISSLNSRKILTPAIENELIKLIDSNDKKLLDAIARAFQNKRWPPEYLREVPRLLRLDNDMARVVLEGLHIQENIPKKIWNEIPRFLQMREEVRISAYEFLRGRRDWPKKIWDEFPKLLTHKESWIRSSATKTIGSRLWWNREYQKFIEENPKYKNKPLKRRHYKKIIKSGLKNNPVQVTKPGSMPSVCSSPPSKWFPRFRK